MHRSRDSGVLLFQPMPSSRPGDVCSLDITARGFALADENKIVLWINPFVLNSTTEGRLRQMPNNSVSIELGTSQNTCFVAMPFLKDFRSEYDQVIKPAIERAGFQALRGDEIYSKRNVMGDVWKALRECTLVIAELSGRNPNVLYELGLAHAIGKPAILLTRKEQDVPFDLKGLRYLFYETKNPFWGDALAQEIYKMISGIIEDSSAPHHLDGIKVHSTDNISLSRPAEVDTDTNGLLDGTSWTGTWGIACNRHSGTLILHQRGSVLWGTVVVTHEHERTLTIVQEAVRGSLKDSKVMLDGIAYTFLIQGQCSGYGLDVFRLELAEDRRTMIGRIPQRLSGKPVTHDVSFIRGETKLLSSDAGITSNSDV